MSDPTYEILDSLFKVLATNGLNAAVGPLTL